MKAEMPIRYAVEPSEDDQLPFFVFVSPCLL